MVSCTCHFLVLFSKNQTVTVIGEPLDFLGWLLGYLTCGRCFFSAGSLQDFVSPEIQKSWLVGNISNYPPPTPS